MRNPHVLPWFSTVAEGVGRRADAPDHGCLFLGEDIGRGHLVFGFGFKHIDAISRLRHEIGLIVMLRDTLFVRDLELP